MELKENLERLFKYAQEHADKAESLIAKARSEQRVLSEVADKASANYKKTILQGLPYVPVEFMKADNNFEGARDHYISTQEEIVMNIAFSLSFCGEIIDHIITKREESLLSYRRRIRILIEKLISITQSEVLQHASLVSLAPIITHMESSIVIHDPIIFGRLRQVLRHLRQDIAYLLS